MTRDPYDTVVRRGRLWASITLAGSLFAAVLAATDGLVLVAVVLGLVALLAFGGVVHGIRASTTSHAADRRQH